MSKKSSSKKNKLQRKRGATEPPTGQVLEKHKEPGKKGLLITGSVWSSPLPPPHVLAEYKLVAPAVLESIILQAEQAQKDVSFQLRERAREKRWVQISGTWVVTLATGGCLGMIALGQGTAGALGFIAELGTLTVIALRRKKPPSD